MALYGTGLKLSLERVGLGYHSTNSPTGLLRSSGTSLNQRKYTSLKQKCWRITCSTSRKSTSPVESEENQRVSSVLDEEELEYVIKFKMSDFKVSDHVSVGLGGRADEEVFEATVKDSLSPLYNTKVVLRQLMSSQAKRRGKRAIEVLKKLVHRRLMYHSYSMQVHGYVSSSMIEDGGSFTLVHGYHGSFSLRHWLQFSDWLPVLEATLALGEESVRRVGDDTVGGPAVSRQLRLIRILMRDLLIGVNYLHSHGLAHTELRLENVHISPVDKHIKVGILGNAADFYESSQNNMERRKMMIAFDMRCVGFMMAKMVLRELMDPTIFAEFKSFLTKGNDPSCLREFLLQILNRNSPSGNAGLQILDRNWGAGWNLLSCLLATKSSKRISCLEALRHPFLCGPRWRVSPSVDIIRWGLGSTVVRITEEYIYRQPQRSRLAYFIELMEMLNPHRRPRNWLDLLPGKWRLLYSTGRHIGLTLRRPSAQVIIGDVLLTVSRTSTPNANFSLTSDINFRVMVSQNWPHDKSGISGKLQVNSISRLTAGRRLYVREDKTTGKFPSPSSTSQNSVIQKFSGRTWRQATTFKEFPTSLPVAKLTSQEVELTMSLNDPLSSSVDVATNVVREVRTQVPPEIFDLSKFVCGTYLDARLLVLRGVNGSALLFTRVCD